MCHAVLFWIFSKRVICSLAAPAEMALWSSNLKVIMDETSIVVELSDKNGLIDAIFQTARIAV